MLWGVRVCARGRVAGGSGCFLRVCGAAPVLEPRVDASWTDDAQSQTGARVRLTFYEVRCVWSFFFSGHSVNIGVCVLSASLWCGRDALRFGFWTVVGILRVAYDLHLALT